MNVTIFRNLGEVNSPHVISLNEALERIRSGRSKTKVEAIRRKLFLGEDYSQDKKDLPFVVFSAAKTQAVQSKKGHMTHREDASVVEHSGLFILDFDNVDVELKKAQLQKDSYIYSYWTGPSGTGVKALVKCPSNIDAHNLYYTAFLDRYPDLDPTSRSLSRGTFESYDPQLYINPQSLLWDKKLTEEERRKNKEKDSGRRGAKIISTAVAMVRSSFDGTKHTNLLGAANLLGGYIATGRVNEDEAIKVLEEEIKLKNPSDFDQAQKTIRDGISHGKSRPLIESKKIEKAQQYLRREDGSYDFLADDAEMLEYELAVINGTLEMGLPTGLNGLDHWWMFKKKHLVWIGSIDNTGKSFLVWYLAVLAAVHYGWRFVINANENGDGQLRKKLKEFYLGKSIKVADDEELTIAHDFVKKHFRIMTSRQLHTIEDWLLKAELIFDEGFEFDVLIGDPFNSYDVLIDNMHLNNLKVLNHLRIFKENYSAIWMTDHVNSTAARKRDKEGYVEVPWKSDIEYGQLKANKVDDFLMIHRLINHPLKKNDLEIHVHKIKDRETGGNPTQKDNPVIIEMNKDFCGYTCGGRDPIQEYWQKKNI